MTYSLNLYRGLWAAVLAVAGLAAMPAAAHACGAYDLLINKTGPATVERGQDVQYTLHLSEINPGKSDVAIEIDITDTIPGGLLYKPELTKIVTRPGQRYPFIDERNPSGVPYYQPTGPRPSYFPQCSLTNGKIHCRLPYLGNDESASRLGVASVDILLTFAVPQTTQCDSILTNVVTAVARTQKGEFDTNPANNTGEHSLTVTCPEPTPTPTPTPTPEKNPGLDVQKTDHRDVTRPGHSLTYEIVAENTGDQDLHDVRLTDTVPSHLTVTSISDGGSQDGRVITWKNISLEPGQKKTVTFKATVKQNTPNNTVLHNRVEAKSDDHDLHDEATDDTKVVIQKVAGVTTEVKPAVPVTATTGATSLLMLLATGLGGGALAAIARKI